MAIAALIAWIVTAAGGFYLLATWIRKGGHRRVAGASSNFPPALIFGHFALAAIGLIVWIIFVATDKKAFAWTSFGLLVVIALLGFTMLIRWLPAYRGRVGTGGRVTEALVGGPAERHFPVAVVAGHGVLAVTTVVLVLLAAAGVGGS
jgi:hypothetical protein